MYSATTRSVSKTETVSSVEDPGSAAKGASQPLPNTAKKLCALIRLGFMNFNATVFSTNYAFPMESWRQWKVTLCSNCRS